MKKWYRNLSMNQRLASIVVAAVLPMAVLLMYLLWAIFSTMNAYSDINRNVSKANEYVKDFKDRIDYTVYLAVIGNKSFQKLELGRTTVNGIVTVNPYRYIRELTKVCNELSENATVDSNRNQVSRIENSLDSLNNCIRSLEKNIQGDGSYDDNMEILRNDIYTLTGLVQEGIQDYIHVETMNFANVKAELEHQNQKLFTTCFITVIIVVIISVFLAVRAARSVSVPIKKLCSLTGKVAEGDFTVRGKVDSTDEIAVLTRNFNEMTTELGVLVEDIKQNQENLRIIEIKLLQAQINPHFLYNTLDTIVWLAEAGKKEEVVSMVTYLSEFFRTTLSGGKDFIKIRDEKRHVESYLKIQQFRYQDVLEYDVQIEDGICDYTIPKLMLQPLVENALVHGIRNKRGKGHLTVTGRRDGKKIIFQVIDDGKGMTGEELAKLRQCIADNDNNATDNGGFGIVNVNQRIRSYYGEEYGVLFDSEPGKGTTATVLIEAKNI